MQPQLTSIAVHPVKSTAIRPLGRARVTPAGLGGDRTWMVVDADHAMVSARTDRELFTIVADTPDTDPAQSDALLLSHRPVDGRAPVEPIRTATPDGPAIDLTLHGRPMQGVPADAEATAWVREVLGRHDVTLIWCDDPTRRALNPTWSRPGEHTAFADSAPVTLVSKASVRQVADWVVETALERGEEPTLIPAERFRPNLVIDGVEAFTEDGWRRIRLGESVFRVAAPVDRCVMTTIDAPTLGKGPEPIRTLARHRKWDGKTWLSVKLVPEELGEIRVGDALEVLE